MYNFKTINNLDTKNKLHHHVKQYTVIDWVRGQQLFCFTRGLICCPKPKADGNSSVRGSNKTAVVRGTSL